MTDTVEEYEFPVSAAQRRLLVLERLTPGTAQYAVYAAYAVDGRFDLPVFELCVAILAERHEALRTTFRVVDGEFVQVIHGRMAPELRVVRDMPVADVDGWLLAEAARPFDLEHGPLLRVLILVLEDGTHRILLATHHLIADGWSLNLLVRELSACYAALLAEREIDLPDPALQYADYAVWQREQTAAGAYEGQIAYWREALKGAPPVLTLPPDLPRPQVRGATGGYHLFDIPDTTTTALDRLAREVSVTPTVAWFTAFAVFLGRLAGQSQVVVGTPVAGRDRAELQDAVGMFVNTLALPVDLSGAPSVSFRELLSRTRETFLGAQENQDVPFDLVVEALAPERGLDQDPVYQVVCSLEDADGLPLALGGAKVRRLELFLDVAKFDFMAQAERTATGLRVRFVYRAELYSPTTIGRWAGLMRALLAQLVADDGRRAFRSVSWLTAEERSRLIDVATGPRQPIEDPDLTVVDLIERQVRARPDALAIVTRDESVTYQQLDERSSRVAGHLAASGVGPGSVVGLCLPRTAAMPVAVLGVLKAGAGYLPLDPEHPPDRLDLLAADAGADLVLDEQTMAPALAAQPLAADGDARRAGPRDLAYLVYTSGSTGRPKGVAIEHRSLADYVRTRREAFDVTAADRVANLGAFTFDLSVSDMFLALTAGAELHIFGPGERLGVPLADRLRADRISWVMMLPSMLASLDPQRLPDLRNLLVGAEALPAALIGRWAPGRTFRNVYGPTETTVTVTAADLSSGDTPVVIGRPLPNARVYVLDDQLEPAPLGVVGEIYISGPGLARGYVGRAALTAERFVADPFGEPGTRMYRSGDLGRYLPGGLALEILGRVDDQVKIRGYRIEPGEVEGALAGHEAVRRAVVVAHDDGGDDRRLVAYLVPKRADAPPMQTELRAWLAERLPAHLVPAVFVTLETLPTTASGKVDKAALPAPSNVRPQLARGYIPPRTELERRISAVWAQVLHLDRVGVCDNFFDLGGTSVRLLAVHNRLTEKADEGVEQPLSVDLVAMFRHPTVAALAEHLSDVAPSRQTGAERGADRRRRLDNLRRPRPNSPGGTDRKANQ